MANAKQVVLLGLLAGCFFNVALQALHDIFVRGAK